MDKVKKKIAITDLETSGDVFGVHEILEIGLVLEGQSCAIYYGAMTAYKLFKKLSEK